MNRNTEDEIKNVKPALQQTQCCVQPLLKVCSKCHNELPKNNFYSNKKNKDGLRSHCKKCHAEGCKNATKKYHNSNKDYWNAYHRNYRKTHQYNEQFKKNKSDQAKRRREKLVDAVVALSLSNKIGIPYIETRKMKQLIEAERQILKIKKYVKQQSNKN